MKLDDLKIDAVKAEQGGWVGDIPLAGFEGVRLKVRGLGNADYRKLQGALARSSSRSKRNNIAEIDRINIKLLHETILLEWDGIDDTPYSKDMAFKLLSDPEFQRFRQAVEWAAMVVADRDAEALAADAKNSSTP